MPVPHARAAIAAGLSLPTSLSTAHNHPSLSSTSSPVFTHSTPHTSPLMVHRSWLSMHQDLIAALTYFASSHHHQETVGVTESLTREKVLEQSVVQQNQIVGMLQQMVVSLEEENKCLELKVSKMEHRIHQLSVYKEQARLAEERLKEMVKSSGLLGSQSGGMISLSAISSFEKALLEKDKMIAFLQSKVDKEEGKENSGVVQDSSSTMNVSAGTELAIERVRVVELEEELLLNREASRKACNKLANQESEILRKESEIQLLRHEIEVAKQVGYQQQDAVMGLHTTLLDRDAQISSLTRALEHTTQTRQEKMAQVGDSQSMFDLVQGREIFTSKIYRVSVTEGLGFSVNRIEMPISSRTSGLVVRAVGDRNSKVLPGDEILEVNGYSCRSQQEKAIKWLEKGKGAIKIVFARELGPATFVGRIRSTPVIPDSSHSTLWTTATETSLAPIPPAQLSASSDTSLSPIPHSTPQHYELSLTTSPTYTSQDSESSSPIDTHSRPQPIGRVKSSEIVGTEQQLLIASPSRKDLEEGDEGAMDREAVVNLEVEVKELREEAQQWKSLQADLEGELDETKSELKELKLEHQHTTAENLELQQLIKSRDSELSEIQGHFGELQQSLECVKEKMEREEERTLKLERNIEALSRELVETKTAWDAEKQQAAEKEQKAQKFKVGSEEEKSELRIRITTLQSQNEQLRADETKRSAQLIAAHSQINENKIEMEKEKDEFIQQSQQLRAEILALREKHAADSSSFQFEVEKLQSQVSSLKTILMEAEKKEAEMKIENRHLRQVADESDQQLKNLHEIYSKVKEETNSFKEQAESKTVECESLTRGLKKAEEKQCANRETVTRQQKQIEELRRSNNQLQIELRKTEQQLKMLQSEKTQMMEKLQSQDDQLFSELEKVIAENTSLQERLETTEQLANQLEQVQKELEDKREVEKELSLKNTEINQLKNLLTNVEATVEHHKMGKQKSDDLVASMSFVHDQDQSRLKEMEEILSKHQEELEQTKCKLSDLGNEESAKMQQLRAQCVSLEESNKGIVIELEKEKALKVSEVNAIKSKYQVIEQSHKNLQRELEAQETANSINKASISQLQVSLEQAEEGQAKMQMNLQEILQRNHQLQLELETLQSHTRQLETEKDQLCRAKESLSENSAELKQQLKHSNSQLETLNAKLQATTQNLAVAMDNMQNSAQQESQMTQQASQLKCSLSDTENQLENTKLEMQEVTLSLHAREEEISQLKIQLQLTQSEKTQLHTSVASLQNATDMQNKKVKSLEMEQDKMRLSMEQLVASETVLKDALLEAKNKMEHDADKHKQELDSLTQQLADGATTEKEHVRKIQRLEASLSEARGTVEQLLAAQEALKGSLTALGDEKEGEVVRLREQIVSLESSLVSAQQKSSEAHNREEKLQEQLIKLEEDSQTTANRLDDLQEENESLQEEVKRNRETEMQLTELHSKVDALEESQKEKSGEIMTLRSELEESARKLQAASTENQDLGGKVKEMAALSLSLAEKKTELEKVKGDLAGEVKAKQKVFAEKDQLLEVLKRLEVEKHTMAMTQPATLQISQEADREQLITLLREKEEEAARLQEYVGKLLSAVVEKAPFVLEKLS